MPTIFDHLGIIFLMAYVAYGMHIAQQDGMILGWLGKLWKVFPTWLQKPLWTCPPCMCSVWGGLTLYCYMTATCAPIIVGMIPIYLLASAGMAAYLNR